MLPADARLNQQTMRAILASGHSRIPVYTRGDRYAHAAMHWLSLGYDSQEWDAEVKVSHTNIPLLPLGHTTHCAALCCTVSDKQCKMRLRTVMEDVLPCLLLCVQVLNHWPDPGQGAAAVQDTPGGACV